MQFQAIMLFSKLLKPGDVVELLLELKRVTAVECCVERLIEPAHS